jgi:hypothetical protein
LQKKPTTGTFSNTDSRPEKTQYPMIFAGTGRSCIGLVGRIALALTLFFASTTFLKAQVLYGTMTENVTDPSGAAIPSASVKALNVDTGIERESTTNGQGLYTFTDLNPGTYHLIIAAEGFTATTQDNVAILTNTAQRVNVQLAVGSTDQDWRLARLTKK